MLGVFFALESNFEEVLWVRVIFVIILVELVGQNVGELFAQKELFGVV